MIVPPSPLLESESSSPQPAAIKVSSTAAPSTRTRRTLVMRRTSQIVAPPPVPPGELLCAPYPDGAADGGPRKKMGARRLGGSAPDARKRNIASHLRGSAATG